MFQNPVVGDRCSIFDVRWSVVGVRVEGMEYRVQGKKIYK